MYIRDVKSSNGTFVNNDRLSNEGMESEPYELKSEDIVVCQSLPLASRCESTGLLMTRLHTGIRYRYRLRGQQDCTALQGVRQGILCLECGRRWTQRSVRIPQLLESIKIS